MSALRTLGSSLASSMLGLLLLAFVLLISIVTVFGTPKHIEKSFEQSKVYEALLPSALEQASKEGEMGNIPLGDPAVRAAFTRALPPARLQTYAETMLDGTYAWLQGDTPKPQFTVDLTSAKNDIANAIGVYLQQRLATLPTCSNLIAVSADPYTATCVPRGVDTGAIIAEAKQEVLNNSGFLDDTTFTMEDLQGREGQTDYNTAPAVYRSIMQGTWITGLLALVFGVIIIFLATTKRKGLRRVAIIAIVTGTLLILMTWVTYTLLRRVTEELARQNDSLPIQEALGKAARMLGGDVYQWWLWVGASLVVVGVGVLVGLRLIHRPDSTPLPVAETEAAPKKTIPIKKIIKTK